MSPFRYPVLVRWSDIDSYDHVNNVRYFDYFQEARIAFLADIFGTAAEGFFDLHPIVLAHQTVDAGTDGTVYARATSVLVGVDETAQAKRELTEAERDVLTRHLAD